MKSIVAARTRSKAGSQDVKKVLELSTSRNSAPGIPAAPLGHRMHGAHPCMDDQRRRLNARQIGPHVQRIEDLPLKKRIPRRPRMGDQADQLGRFVGRMHRLDHRGPGPHEPVFRVPPASAVEKRDERIVFRRLGRIFADRPAPCISIVHNEAGHPFGECRGNPYREGCRLQGGHDGEPVQPRGIGHGQHVLDMGVEPVPGAKWIGQPGAPQIIADQPISFGQRHQLAAQETAAPILFEMRQVVPREQKRRSGARLGPGNAGTVGRPRITDRLPDRRGLVRHDRIIDRDIRHHLEPAALDSPDDLLCAAAVAHGLARGADRGFRHDPSAPDLGDEAVLGHEAPGIAGQKAQDIKDLRLHRDIPAIAEKAVRAIVKRESGKGIDHRNAPQPLLSSG